VTSKGKLSECLHMLGISPNMNTFSYRKLLQKLVYLLQKSGIEFNFSYSWYLHGPYSPDLTRTLYDIVGSGSSPHDELSDLEIASINKLKSLLGKDLYSADRLELLVSIDYLRDRARMIGASGDEVVEALKKVKPYFSEEEIRECWQKSIKLDKILNS